MAKASRFNKINESGSIQIPSISGVVATGLDQLSGIVAIKPMAKYLTGARTILRINGKIIGFAFQISWDIQTPVTEIRTIDEYTAVELAPKQVSVSGTLGCFRIPGVSPTKISVASDNKELGNRIKGFFSNAGEPQSIQPTILNFLHQKYITIEVRDSQTDKLIFFTNKAMITSRTEDLRAENLASMTLQWKAIGWRDETESLQPKGSYRDIETEKRIQSEKDAALYTEELQKAEANQAKTNAKAAAKKAADDAKDFAKTKDKILSAQEAFLKNPLNIGG